MAGTKFKRKLSKELMRRRTKFKRKFKKKRIIQPRKGKAVRIIPKLRR